MFDTITLKTSLHIKNNPHAFKLMESKRNDLSSHINRLMTIGLELYRQYREPIWIVLTALLCLIALNFWIIHGTFRAGLVNLRLEQYDPSLTPALMGLVGWALGCVVVYLLIPALVIKLILKNKLRDYGWHSGSYLKRMPTYSILYFLMLPILWYISQRPDFQQTYPFYFPAEMKQLVIWEIAYGFQFVAAEFFFRGFILLGLRRHFGAPAALIMTLFPYMMVHFEKPYLEAMAAIVAGCILGYIALRSRSIWTGVTLHLAVALSMDLLALWRRGWFLFQSGV